MDGHPKPEREPEPAASPPESDDFADEHSGATFADQLEGGPEGAPEPESPEGYGGQESRWLERRCSDRRNQG